MLTRKQLVPVLLLAACGGSSKPAKVAAPPPPAAKVEEPPPAPPPPQPVVTVGKDAGLATPETVLYDAADDVYFVSNINGGPSAVDGNGFISKIAPDGSVTALKFIDGSNKKTPLNAPKGLAIIGDVLYVSDLDQVRMFDRKTGAAKGTVKLPKATFANDLAVSPTGKLYVTDIGIKIDESGVTPTGTDAVWVIDKKKARVLAKGTELGGPNGLFFDGNGSLWVCTFASGEIYTLDATGKRDKVQKLPKGQLDGLYVDGESIYVSSWEDSSLLKGTAGGEFTVVQGGLTSPADFGFDSKRNIFLFPLFTESTIVGYAK
jgi:glucose/arabinose dehydrogenase